MNDRLFRTYMLGNEVALYRTVNGEVSKLRNTTLASCRHKAELDVNVDKAARSETRLWDMHYQPMNASIMGFSYMKCILGH